MFTIKSLKSLGPQKARRLLISRSSWKKKQQKTDELKLKWTEEAVIGRSCRTTSVRSMPFGPRFLRSLDLEQKLQQRIDLGIGLKMPSWKTYTTKQISKVHFSQSNCNSGQKSWFRSSQAPGVMYYCYSAKRTQNQNVLKISIFIPID